MTLTRKERLKQELREVEEDLRERFDAKLAEILDEQPASYLLTIPGVYEVLAEQYNNDVLDALKEEDADADGSAVLCWKSGCYLTVDQDGGGRCEVHGLPLEEES